MENIDFNRLNIQKYHWEVKELPDGSCRITIRGKTGEDKPLLAIADDLRLANWNYKNEFRLTLKVNPPAEQPLLAVVLLYRPSKNRYVVVVSDDKGIMESSLSGLGEVSEYMKALWTKYLPADKAQKTG